MQLHPPKLPPQLPPLILRILGVPNLHFLTLNNLGTPRPSASCPLTVWSRASGVHHLKPTVGFGDMCTYDIERQRQICWEPNFLIQDVWSFFLDSHTESQKIAPPDPGSPHSRQTTRCDQSDLERFAFLVDWESVSFRWLPFKDVANYSALVKASKLQFFVSKKDSKFVQKLQVSGVEKTWVSFIIVSSAHLSQNSHKGLKQKHLNLFTKRFQQGRFTLTNLANRNPKTSDLQVP